MLLVTVIIPNYNHSLFLDQRIQSVLNQTYEKFEVIILDDNSTDNSREIIEKYRGHPKISQIIYNTVNSGSTFTQWEKGIKLSKGEFIWIAESDDYCELNFMEECMRMYESNPELCLVFANCNAQYGDKAVYRSSKIPLPTGVYEGNKILLNWILKTSDNVWGNTSGVIFRNKFNDYQVPFELLRKYKYAGDKLFFYTICKKNKIGYVSSVLYVVRRNHSYSVTNLATSIIKFNKLNIECLMVLRAVKNDPDVIKKTYRDLIIHYQKRIKVNIHFPKSIYQKVFSTLYSVFFLNI